MITPEWFILVGPISVTTAQFFATPVVQSSIKILQHLKILPSDPTDEELENKNIHIAVHSFFSSLIILVVVSFIYMKFTSGIAEWASWGVVGFCFILVALACLAPDRLINRTDFGEKCGTKLLPFLPFRAQFASWWNKVRIIVVAVSWGLAFCVFLHYSLK